MGTLSRYMLLFLSCTYTRAFDFMLPMSYCTFCSVSPNTCCPLCEICVYYVSDYPIFRKNLGFLSESLMSPSHASILPGECCSTLCSCYGWERRWTQWRTVFKLPSFHASSFTRTAQFACYVGKHWYKLISVFNPTHDGFRELKGILYFSLQYDIDIGCIKSTTPISSESDWTNLPTDGGFVPVEQYRSLQARFNEMHREHANLVKERLVLEAKNAVLKYVL